jgi:hypothetical protein
MSDRRFIESRFKVEEPEKLRMTLVVTATMEDWGKLRDNLEHVAMTCLGVSSLTHELRRQIDSVYAQARRIYWPSVDAEEKAEPSTERGEAS